MIKRILGILSYVGMLLVFGALAARFLKPEWDQYAIYAAWSGLALVVLYTLGQWREIVDYFKQRNARYGALASVGVLVFLGILVAVNYLSTRRNTRWDLTANKQYSLSEQSVKLLQGLKAPVKFMVFDQEANFERFRPRLEGYTYNSKQVQVEYIDADRRPVQTKQYNVDTYGTVVMEYMGRTERVTSDSEQDLTNALIKLLNPQQRKVYFLSGHGEKDPASSERVGYSGIGDALKRDNYQFDKLVLAQTNEIPADATMIVVAGPRTDLLEQEVPILEEYLSKKTGKVLIMLDPPDDLKQPAPMPRLTASAQGVGNRRHQFSGSRFERTDAGRHRAGRRTTVSGTRDHAELRSHHDVPPRAGDHAGQGRARGSHRAVVRPDGATQLGRNRLPLARRSGQARTRT